MVFLLLQNNNNDTMRATLYALQIKHSFTHTCICYSIQCTFPCRRRNKYPRDPVENYDKSYSTSGIVKEVNACFV